MRTIKRTITIRTTITIIVISILITIIVITITITRTIISRIDNHSIVIDSNNKKNDTKKVSGLSGTVALASYASEMPLDALEEDSSGVRC